VVDMIITNLGVFEVQAQGLAVLEMAPGVTQEIIRGQTACPLHF
jgi:acyl CoA:acetate/3-ketoacid CoA transferase beta subunit